MRPFLLAGFVIVLISSCGRLVAKQPNLLVVVSDDHRHDALSCAGHPVLQTPTIDRLANGGVRFTNAFATTSICAASRATIFTALTERSHGFTFGTPPLDRFWVQHSYPALLRSAGYRTGFVGKFGVKIDGEPRADLFDWFQPLDRSPYVKSTDKGSQHVTDLIADRAIEFVNSTTEDQPFCLSISFNAAHAEDRDRANQFPPPPTERGLYADQAMDPPRLVDSFHTLPEFLRRSMNRDRWFWRWDTPEKYQRNVRNYYRMITGLDRNIGRVIEAIERSGRGDRTVVIFLGDNGYYKGDRGLAGKWSHFRESLKIPMVIHDPTATSVRTKKSTTKPPISAAIVLNLDIAPTLLDYAGIDAPPHYQGRSLRTLVESDDSDWQRDSFTCEHLMHHPSIPKWEGIRTKRYTYARYFEQQPPYEFLHDRQADPDEVENFASDPEYVDVLQRLRNTTTQKLSQQQALRRD